MMFIFHKARSPTQTLNALDEYLRTAKDEPVKWLARTVSGWGNEFSYDELAAVIQSGGLDELIDWQERWAQVVNEQLAPLWLSAIAAASAKATSGLTVLSDSDWYVQSWIQNRGGELITQLTEESRRAVMNVILRGQGLNMAPRDVAKEIRPLIGLTARQAQANVNYRDKVYQQYIDGGANPATASKRAEAAALKYAGKQHRYRAETIVLTENAFAYNRGAHMGVSQSIAQGLMGRCEMVWTTAGTNRVCSRCLALKDTVVGHTDESGVTLPPLHPRCRCAIMYREVDAPKALNKPNGRMSVEDDIPQWSPRDKSKVISREEYAKLRTLAETNGIALSGVKNFDGSAKVVQGIIETLGMLIKNFPAVSDSRHKLGLEMSILLNAQDYAETVGRRIKLNAAAYRDVSLLAKEYQKDVADGWFVKGTTWSSIIHHEFGHVVTNIYKLEPLKIACEITELKPNATLDYITDNLSLYAGKFSNGQEIIAEVFADISTGNPCSFSRKLYERILELTRGKRP